MSKQELIDKINQDITSNGLRQITGAKLNDILNDVVDEMALDGGIIEEGNTNAVSGGKVYESIQKAGSKETITNLPIPNQLAGYYNTNASHAFMASNDFNTVLYTVDEGQFFLCSFHLGGVSMAGITFFNNDTFVGQMYIGNNNNIVTDAEVTIPSGVNKMYYCTRVGYADKKVQLIEFESLDDRLTYLENASNDITEIENEISLINQDIESLNNINSEAFITESINKYNQDYTAGIIGTNGNISTATANSYVSVLVPVKPNFYYYISNRLTTSPGIRCMDDLGNKSKVLSALTNAEYINYYMPNVDNTGLAVNGQFKTSPTAKFVQFNLLFNQAGVSDFEKVMLEEVGDVYDPNFIPSSYQPYDDSLRLNSNLLPKTQDAVKELSLKNTPTFLIVGASHGEGYGSVRDKSFASYLSNFLKWNVENFSQTGSDHIEHFNAIMNDIKYGGVKPSELNGGVALIILGGNETAYYTNGVDGKYFKDNIIRLCTALESYGFKPILGSYYGDITSPFDMVLNDVAQEYKYEYININGYASRFYRNRYNPWWYNAHYASRTNVTQWHNYLKMLSDLDSPSSAVKIYRNRNTESDKNNLLFDNDFEKMKLWRELSIGHAPLKTQYNNYVDRLDLAFTNIGSSVNEKILSEYNTLRLGGNLTFNKYGLIEFTFPTIANNLTDVLIKIPTEDSVNIYIRRYSNSNLAINLSGSSAMFLIDTVSPDIQVGAVYTDSNPNNAGVNFTVTSFANGYLIATPSESYEALGLFSGTLTKTSGSGSSTLVYSKVNSSPNANYFTKALKPKGEWIALPYNSNKQGYVLDNVNSFMSYDKLEVLIESNSITFNISSPTVEYKSQGDKLIKNYTKPKLLGYAEKESTQILTYTTFENALTEWNLSNPSAVIWNGVTALGTHITNYFSSRGINNILRLNAGDFVYQDLNNLGSLYEVKKYKLKIVGRFYPEEQTDTNNLTGNQITPSTFDFAKIEVRFKITDTDGYFSKIVYLPANFVEEEIEMVFGGNEVSNQIRITAVDNRVELLECNLYEL